MNNTPEHEKDKKDGNTSIGPLAVIQSVLAAFFGVQSEKRREEDFKHGKPADFILVGILFTILFVISLIVIVNNVVSKAGS